MHRHHALRRSCALPAALTAAAALAVGCGGSGHTPQPGPSGGTASGATTAPAGPTAGPQQPPPTTTRPSVPGSTAHTAGPAPSAGAAWCTTTDLRAAVHALQPAAGNRYAALQFTDVSAHPCRTQGYPGLELLDGAGRPLPTTVVRDPSSTPRLLTLEPGESAWSRLHWGAVAGTGDSPTGNCQQPATAAKVTAPDQTSQSAVTWAPGPVCQRGRIDELPLTAGQAPAY